jgi:MFS family permease
VPPSPRLPASYWSLYWSGGLDCLGDGAYAAAVPLLALTFTDDPRAVAVLAAATQVPWLLFALPVGALVDRCDRIVLMRVAQAVQAGLAAACAVLVQVGGLGLPGLAASAFGLGVGEVVLGTAAQAVLPAVVPADLLHRANGYLQAGTVVGQQFAGPPVGSLLFAVSAALPFTAATGCCALAAVLLVVVPRVPRPAGPHPPLRAAVAEGLRWTRRHRLIRALAVLLGVNTFCGQLGSATLVLLATRELRVEPAGYGLLLAAAAVGGMVGGLVNGWLVARIGPLRALVAALATIVVAFAGIGLSPDAVLLGALLAVTGFATTLWNVVAVGLRQSLVPAPLLGRVTSVYRLLGWGLTPLGALAGGLVADALGPRAPYEVAAAGRGLALLVAAPVLVRALGRAPGLSRRRRPRGG